MILEKSIRQIEPDITVIELRGRLTLGNLLREAEDSVKKLVNSGAGAKTNALDLSGIAFMDSAGIGMLVACNSAAETAGSQFRVAGANARIQQALQITHVDRVLALHKDMDSALAGW